MEKASECIGNYCRGRRRRRRRVDVRVYSLKQNFIQAAGLSRSAAYCCSVVGGYLGLCDKHATRLMQYSRQLLLFADQTQASAAPVSVTSFFFLGPTTTSQLSPLDAALRAPSSLRGRPEPSRHFEFTKGPCRRLPRYTRTLANVSLISKINLSLDYQKILFSFFSLSPSPQRVLLKFIAFRNVVRVLEAHFKFSNET